MFKTKKIMSLLLAIIMTISMGAVSYADETKEVKSTKNIKVEKECYNVTTEEPITCDTRGTSIPSKVWDVTKKGKYNFAGTSYYQDLYTSYKITGKDNYTVTVTNNGSNDLVVKVKTRWSTYSTNTLAPGTTSTYSVSGMTSSKEIYILFQGSDQDFDGSIG